MSVTIDFVRETLAASIESTGDAPVAENAMLFAIQAQAAAMLLIAEGLQKIGGDVSRASIALSSISDILDSGVICVAKHQASE